MIHRLLIVNWSLFMHKEFDFGKIIRFRFIRTEFHQVFIIQ